VIVQTTSVSTNLCSKQAFLQAYHCDITAASKNREIIRNVSDVK